MAVRVQLPPSRPVVLLQRLWERRWLRIVMATLLLFFVAVAVTFVFYYRKYERIVDERIRRPIFNQPAQIYASPVRVEVGDLWTASAILTELRGAGYAAASNGSTAGLIGTYALSGSTVTVHPGPESYHPGLDAVIHIDDGQVDAIAASKGEQLSSYDLEPQLITGLFDAKQRSKRRLLSYNEIPPLVVKSIIAIEDRRFFDHSGINYVRLVEGVLTPIFSHRRMQGGSTLTMQMARGFFLSNERSASRKLAEMTIATILERRFTKEQILELYVNQVDLGQHGSFNIRGFGEAARSYFDRDIKNLTLPEAALLAGLVNGPTYFSPYRHPDRAISRRNLVLKAMLDTGAITPSQYESAKETPLKLARGGGAADQAPYYIDVVRDKLLAEYDEETLDTGGMRVYTALDRQLQIAASEAIEVGMRQVDENVRRLRTRHVKTGKGKDAKVTVEVATGPMPQVALVAIDPHTGEVLALSGGRDYGESQLNHAVAHRPTGSIFKPFVYAAAINTALTGDPEKAYTQTTMLDASEGTFDFNGKPYSPHNFDFKESVGEVTARYALAHSINTATIRLAEMLGYDKVVQLAKAAGIDSVQPTPSMAIGAYDSTAIEMARAYTIFANNGSRVEPIFIKSIAGQSPAKAVPAASAAPPILDPRIAYVITDMLGDVLDEGTARAVRNRFDAPAAGKTGSSHDAWFAGYTTNLLCIVWVGNDDYTDLKIEGAKAALPIWTEFMVRARKLRRYANMDSFPIPQGVLAVNIDKTSNLPANASCPDDYTAYFVDGTIPAASCEHPEGPPRNLFQKMFGIGAHHELVLPPVTSPPKSTIPAANPLSPPGTLPNLPASTDTSATSTEAKEKKRGFWKRLFRGKKDDTSTASTGTAQQP